MDAISDPVLFLQDLVRIHSPSGQEEAIADALEVAFRRRGWSPVRSGRNVHAIVGEGERLLLLNSHTDTVPVGEGWTRDPLDGTPVDGRVYGRGSNDAKGCLVAMIVALERVLAGGAPAGRICLAATCEEETGGEGLGVLVDRLGRLDAAVIGEPTGLNPAVAQKGLLLLEIDAPGRSAHVAWGGGENAISRAARDVVALEGLALDRSHPVLGPTTIAVTQITGGTRHNVIPDHCRITVDIRTTPSYEPDELVKLVEARVASPVRVRSRRFRAVDVDPEHPVVRAALAARPGAVPFGSPTLSDWVWLEGVPAVKVGPGQSPRSHTPDEYLEVAELLDGIDFYERLIRSYFELAGEPRATGQDRTGESAGAVPDGDP